MPYRSLSRQRLAQSAHYQANKVAYKARAREQGDRIRALIREAKDKPCADCDLRYPFYVMQFDHRPGSRKRFELSDMGRHGSYSLLTVRLEIGKCDVVCANCHAERTYQRGQRFGSGRASGTEGLQSEEPQPTLF